ncbi:L-rhamnose mutarotase [Alysiella crassa]|uniref:Uncharacterized conserved protein n=1 Tax=Alysiella crassa TaxID=153491 RepID=A0A376BMN6_9NEIS|nr:L-rhamnose mutarotase [Alysiella crassa]UOP07330.1 L-rhamnose mutarotase [Alysiella crassa]SSY70494.1 Uncharacterized conserved protein [Alysiella crassa]
MKNTYVLMLDLQDNPDKIAEYEQHHRAMWAEVEQHIAACGITQMTIYRLGTSLVMLMDTDDTFSFERMAQLSAQNETVQRWEKWMWDYQQATPFTPAGEKWVAMDEIYRFQAA